jgi:ribokinase
MAGHLVVVGAINTDYVISAPVLPAPGQTVSGGGLRTFGGGKAANAAVAAARAGARVHLVGAVGADSAGNDARELLLAEGIVLEGVAILEDVPTGAALIVVDAKGENQIALGPGANGAITPDMVEGALRQALPGASLVLVSTEIPLPAVAAAMHASRRASVPLMLNPAPVLAGLADLLTLQPVLTPNELELFDLADRISGTSQPAPLAVDAALRALHDATGTSVIATLGAAGCRVLEADGELHTFTPPRVEVVDTTGAGDTFNGVLAARLALGDTLLAAVRMAVVASALSVTAAGARGGMPDAATLRAKAVELGVEAER